MSDAKADPTVITRAQRGADKVARIPVKVEPTIGPLPRKPAWIKAKAPTDPKVIALKQLLRDKALHTVCEEASCPNLGECFAHGTATFMIMGALCTRRCPFCDVAHGKPLPLDAQEPAHVAEAVYAMKLRYVVITSVDRDDLRDGGAGHFAACVREIRELSPGTRVEALTPDFRGREDRALDALQNGLPDIFNHNIETVPRLYRAARPGADYTGSLELLRRFKLRHPAIPTKAGLMLGLGERDEEIVEVLHDLRAVSCDIVTLGQYLAPSRAHMPVSRYVTPAEFDALSGIARAMGFRDVVAGPLVRSSYYAERALDMAGVRSG